MNDSTVDFDVARDDLINVSTNFLSALVNYYGQDRANEMWDQFRNIVGAGIQNDMLVKMLRADTGHIVKFTMSPESNYYVAAIKEVRTSTGLGLKEAKDIVDAARDASGRGGEVTLKCADDAARLRRQLRLLGITVR